MAANRIVIQPDPRRKRVQIQVESPSADRVSVEIAGTAARAEGAPGTPLLLSLPEFIPWLPGSPHLYTLSCTVPGQPTVTKTFGMREISVQEQRFTLNQRPFVLKGLRTAAQTPIAPADFARLTAAGFNWLRCSAADENLETLLAAADTAGLLISINAEAFTDEPAIATLTDRFQHHASLLFWESADSEIATTAFRRFDPTRPVLVQARANTESRLFRPFHVEAERYEPLEVSTFCPVSRETESFLTHLGHANTLTLVNVLGFTPPPAPPSAEVISLLADGVRTCAEHLRINPRVGAYCFAGTAAKSEPAFSAFAEGQAPVRAVISLAHTNLVPREEVEVSVVLLNESKIEGRGELSLQVVGPTNQTLWKKKRGVKIPKHGKELWTGTVAASGSIGPHKFVVQLWTDKGLAGEGQAAFFVSPPVDAWRGTLDVLDPGQHWQETLRRLAPQIDPAARVILVPPLARSIRAYPDNPFGQVLGRVREGAVAILFAPPPDWADLSATLSTPVDAKLNDVLGEESDAAWLGRLHPVFEGLPAGGPLGKPYRGVLTRRMIAGEGEDDIAPALRSGADSTPGAAMLVRKFGNGRIIITTMRLLERIGHDPVADRLFVNLLRYSERRALPFQGIARAEMKAVEWLRRERSRLRAWRVIGPFPNADGTGHATAYPPESAFDADAAYRGLYRAVSWTTRHQGPEKIDELNLATIVAPDTFRAGPLSGTYYAHAEIGGDARAEPVLALQHTGAAKCWLNGRVIYESAPADPMDDRGGNFEGGVVIKQGRNTLLVKVSAVRVEPRIEVQLRRGDGTAAWRWQ